jgi:fumarylpyruvate hydrolase
MPLRRIFCVGRNYHGHAAEMGAPVDKQTMRPFYFFKDPGSIVESGASIAYPPGTDNLHYEMELVLAIGKPGFRVTMSDAQRMVLGYAAGLDLTRRDLQLRAREAGKPWDLAKNFENAAVCSEIVPNETIIGTGAISLEVNGIARQQADLSMLIWSIPELIADLSSFYHLQPGDLIYTGTPEGVGALVPGDKVRGRVEGVGEVSLDVCEPLPAEND